jgi:outer membrane protein assembly factor BamB
MERFRVRRSRSFWLASLIGLWLVAPVSAQEPEEGAAEAQPARKGGLLQNLFRIFAPGSVPNDREDPASDPIETRVPRDSRITALWTSSGTAVKQQDWKRAVELLQNLLDLPEDAVIRAGRTTWRSVRAAARQRMGTLPPNILEEYRERYSGLAAQLLAQARATGDRQRLVDVATRYFHTSAGQEAAELLALWQIDQQEYLPAALWLQELAAAGAPQTRDPRFALRLAWVAREAGLATDDAQLQALLARDEPVMLGGERWRPQEWWDRSRLASQRDVPSTDWREWGGTASRDGVARSGPPLLLPVWSQTLTEVHALRQRIALLERDLEDRGTPRVPAGAPIVVGSRVAFRDLRGVRVVDRVTGETLWHTIEGISPERILQGLPGQGDDAPLERFRRRQIQIQNFDQEYVADDAEMHPLASWLYRDAASGQLSSDGTRLFLLEDHAVLTRNQAIYDDGEGQNGLDMYGASWRTNRLSAYDLETGRLAWTIGGPPSLEAAALPLAGSFFYSVPTAASDELYVIGSTGTEIRLHALDPASGQPRWSQLLAFADTKIETDIARRWMGAPVALEQGILVCPTTVGWIMGVDRLRRSLLWAHRYLPQDEQEVGNDPTERHVPVRNLEDRWLPAAPILHGRLVLWAPPEGEELEAIDLLTGETRWTWTGEHQLAALPGNDDLCLIQGARGLTALRWESGEVAWEATWDEGDLSTGRGCVTGDEVLIPLAEGGLWRIAVATGEILERQTWPTSQGPLGTLVKAGGDWLAYSSQGCRLFAERQPFLEELARTTPEATLDLTRRFRLAEYHLLQADFAKVLSLLPNPEPAWSPETQERRRRLEWDALTGLVQSDPAQGAAHLARLSAIALDEQERFTVEAAQVAQRSALGDHAGAFQLLWDLGGRWSNGTVAPPTVLVRPSEQRMIQVDRLDWLVGRLSDLYLQGNPETRRMIDTRVQGTIDAALGQPIDAWLPLARWLRFHPAGYRLDRAIAREYAAAGLFAHAEGELAAWLEHRDPPTAMDAGLRLAALWQQFGLTDDARRLIARLARRPAAAAYQAEDGLTLTALTEQLGPPPDPHGPLSAETQRTRQQPLSLRRLPAANSTPTMELPTPAGLPSLGRLQGEYDYELQRVRWQSRDTGAWVWQAPLRTTGAPAGLSAVSLHFLQHRLAIANGDMLQLVCPSTREQLWSIATDADGEELGMSRPTPPMLIDTAAMEPDAPYWIFRQQEPGRIVLATATAIGVQGRRTLELYDPRTGRLRWRHEGLPPYAFVTGTDELVMISSGDDEETRFHRTSDGQPLDLPEYRKWQKQTLAFVGHDALRVQQPGGLRFFGAGARKVALTRQDPVTNAERWRIEYRAGVSLGRVGEEHVLVLDQARDKTAGRPLELVELEAGTRIPLEPLPVHKDEESVTPLIDDERIYLVVNHDDGGYSSYGDSLLSTRLHGTLYAYDRATGRRLWDRRVKDQNLVLDQFAASPVILCLARNWKQIDEQSYSTLHLEVFDKATGRTLHTSDSPALFNGFNALRLAEPEHQLELWTYNLRLRLVPEPLVNTPPTAVVMP